MGERGKVRKVVHICYRTSEIILPMNGYLIHSIYCNACTKSMCCICAFLDSQHTGQHCDIRKEIQRRQDELQHLNLELKEKESFYENTYNILQEQLKTMEEVRNETKEQIQQKVDAMVQHVQEKGEKLIATLEKWHGQFVQDFEGKMQLVEGMRKRMASSKQLVEKMHLYASDQEMMDMHHFILKSLKYLKRKQTPAEDFKVQVENFTEIKHQLQALFDQVTKTAGKMHSGRPWFWPGRLRKEGDTPYACQRLTTRLLTLPGLPPSASSFYHMYQRGVR